jgi:hypothetical protein
VRSLLVLPSPSGCRAPIACASIRPAHGMHPCGVVGADARPNWKEQPARESADAEPVRALVPGRTRAILVAHGFSIGMLAEL